MLYGPGFYAGDRTMRLDRAVAALLEGLGQHGFQPFEKIGVAATRQAVDSFAGLQKPKGEVARIAEVSYGSAPEQRARVYVPPGPVPGRRARPRWRIVAGGSTSSTSRCGRWPSAPGSSCPRPTGWPPKTAPPRPTTTRPPRGRDPPRRSRPPRVTPTASPCG